VENPTECPERNGKKTIVLTPVRWSTILNRSTFAGRGQILLLFLDVLKN
jgi:hypothetical protein